MKKIATCALLACVACVSSCSSHAGLHEVAVASLTSTDSVIAVRLSNASVLSGGHPATEPRIHRFSCRGRDGKHRFHRRHTRLDHPVDARRRLLRIGSRRVCLHRFRDDSHAARRQATVRDRTLPALRWGHRGLLRGRGEPTSLHGRPRWVLNANQQHRALSEQRPVRRPHHGSHRDAALERPGGVSSRSVRRDTPSRSDA